MFSKNTAMVNIIKKLIILIAPILLIPFLLSAQQILNFDSDHFDYRKPLFGISANDNDSAILRDRLYPDRGGDNLSDVSQNSTNMSSIDDQYSIYAKLGIIPISGFFNPSFGMKFPSGIGVDYFATKVKYVVDNHGNDIFWSPKLFITSLTYTDHYFGHKIMIGAGGVNGVGSLTNGSGETIEESQEVSTGHSIMLGYFQEFSEKIEFLYNAYYFQIGSKDNSKYAIDSSYVDFIGFSLGVSYNL